MLKHSSCFVNAQQVFSQLDVNFAFHSEYVYYYRVELMHSFISAFINALSKKIEFIFQHREVQFSEKNDWRLLHIKADYFERTNNAEIMNVIYDKLAVPVFLFVPLKYFATKLFVRKL